jgi:hypothetical protein
MISGRPKFPGPSVSPMLFNNRHSPFQKWRRIGHVVWIGGIAVESRRGVLDGLLDGAATVKVLIQKPLKPGQGR